MSSQETDQAARDTADLERFGYKQELKRELGTFSSFAVAFSYISPSTGIFTLFFLGHGARSAASCGGRGRSWRSARFIVALNFAELSSHFPVAGSVFQWTKYLAGRTYAWFTGWIYLFAGILTVASVCATLPIALLPALNNMFGWSLNTDLGSADQKLVALDHARAHHGPEHLRGEARRHRQQHRRRLRDPGHGRVRVHPGDRRTTTRASACRRSRRPGAATSSTRAAFFLVGMFMSLFVIYGFDTASTLAEETQEPAAGGAEGGARRR